MEVDETMITGHLDHARFSGERCGRILNHLSCSHSVFRTGESTRSLGEDVAGRIAKPNFASVHKSVWDAVYKDGRPPESSMRPARARRGRARVFTSHEPQQKGQAMEPVRAAFFQKRSIMGALRGSNPEKLTFILILVPTRFLFHARFRFERRNPRLERRCLDPFVTGVPP